MSLYYQGKRLKKKLGQHFLTDLTVVHRILAHIQPREKEQFIEIGAGDGALTQHFIDLHHGVIHAIEIDAHWATQLQQRYLHHAHMHVHQQDALALTLDQYTASGEHVRLIGNLPYCISTPLLMRLCEQHHWIQDAHFMLQHAVAERICASPHDRAYGKLSVVMQYYFETEQLFAVPPSAFTPAPRVQSSVIRLIPKHQRQTPAQTKCFKSLVFLAFQAPRKTIGKNVKNVVSTTMLLTAGIDPNQRPAEISVEHYMRLTALLL